MSEMNTANMHGLNYVTYIYCDPWDVLAALGDAFGVS